MYLMIIHTILAKYPSPCGAFASVWRLLWRLHQKLVLLLAYSDLSVVWSRRSLYIVLLPETLRECCLWSPNMPHTTFTYTHRNAHLGDCVLCAVPRAEAAGFAGGDCASRVCIIFRFNGFWLCKHTHTHTQQAFADWELTLTSDLRRHRRRRQQQHSCDYDDGGQTPWNVLANGIGFCGALCVSCLNAPFVRFFFCVWRTCVFILFVFLQAERNSAHTIFVYTALYE